MAAVTVGRQRQNKNERPGRLRAWREMAASARMEELVQIAQPGVARAMARDEGGATDCAMAQALAAQMALVPWQPKSLRQNSRLQCQLKGVATFSFDAFPSNSRAVSSPGGPSPVFRMDLGPALNTPDRPTIGRLR